jgi:hypothetical protein
MAERLGLQQATQPGDRYGDAVFLAALSGLRKHKLRLWLPLLEKFETIYKVSFGIRAVAALALLASLGTMGMAIYDYWNFSSDISRLEDEKRVKKIAYEQLRQDSERMTDDIDKLSDSVSVYESLMQESYTPVPFMVLFSEKLSDKVLLDSIEWEIVENASGAAASPPPPAPAANNATTPALDARFIAGTKQVKGKFAFDLRTPSDKPDAVKEEANAVLAELKATFPGYEFDLQITGITKETDRVELALTEGSSTPKQAARANFTFKGPVLMPAPPATGGQP